MVTLAELELGVHMAGSDEIRARRLQTLGAVRATYAALPVTEDVASAFAELVAACHRAGRRPKVQDTLIAATARAHEVALYSQDADLNDFPGITVVRV